MTATKYPRTDELRRACKERGIGYAVGYRIGGKTTNEDNVTTLWNGSDGWNYLTFEEDEHGSLFCYDAMEPTQAIAAYLAGKEESNGGR